MHLQAWSVQDGLPQSLLAEARHGSGPGTQGCFPSGLDPRSAGMRHLESVDRPSLPVLSHHKRTGIHCEKALETVTKNCCAHNFGYLGCDEEQGHLFTWVLCHHKNVYGGTRVMSVRSQRKIMEEMPSRTVRDTSIEK